MKEVDVIIAGSGFGGSIMAMILRRLGRSVAMIETGKHPRFAIGESSTPVANLLLEELGRRFDLPELASFSKWGAWQAQHPEVACGLKRGFTFYRHDWNRPVNFADRSQQLLVAASPRDEIADTHWYRPDFDAWLARRAVELGAELHEQAIFQLSETEGRWKVEGISPKGELGIEAPFLIDATGPRGCLFNHFGFRESRAGFHAAFPETEALFAHFKQVARLDPPAAGVPYPPDDAALHHIFDGGWIWALRFNNGITSAGAAVRADLAKDLRLQEREGAWKRLLERLPTVGAQFQNAEATTPFFHQKRIAFRSPQAAGKNWLMLPSAAGFVDPLFSTGFALNLLGIERVAGQFEIGQPAAEWLSEYERITWLELDAAARLVADAYNSFANFDEFIKISRVYFAAAIWAETLRRLGRKPPAFLLSDQPIFQEFFGPSRRGALERIDLAGLTDPSRQNWHPVLASDLFANAHKIPATPEEIGAMLKRCGF